MYSSLAYPHKHVRQKYIYLQELEEDREKRPCSSQQQGQHGFSSVHVQTPLVLILMTRQDKGTKTTTVTGVDRITVRISVSVLIQ